MLLGGVGLLFRATAAWSARVLFPYLIVWLLLKAPALVVAPQMEAVWLGFGEIAVLLAGGWVLFATLAGLREGSPLTFATGENGIRLARTSNWRDSSLPHGPTPSRGGATSLPMIYGNWNQLLSSWMD
jgi:hypothetical protein